MKAKRSADISSGVYHSKGIHDSYGWLCTDNEVNHPPQNITNLVEKKFDIYVKNSIMVKKV